MSVICCSFEELRSEKRASHCPARSVGPGIRYLSYGGATSGRAR